MRKYTLEERQARSVIKSALKAIRAHCLECVGGSVEEVEKCTGPLCIGDHGICPLHSYRFGKGRRSGIKAKASPVKAIAKHCLWCCGGSAIERKLCPSTKCWLYPFREGKNPFLSEKQLEAAREAAKCNPGKFQKTTCTSCETRRMRFLAEERPRVPS